MATRILVLIALAQSTLWGAETNRVQLPSKENFHLFLLAGQSNMAGRGQVAAEDKLAHPRVFALSKKGQWRPAADPIHYDKSIAGVGLAKSFAEALAESDGEIAIGLTPAACGGSPISAWEPGVYYEATKSHPYDDAIKRMRRAMKDGVVKGVLWHQGESDCNKSDAPLYEERLTALIARFREDLNSPELPFIIGQLGQFKSRPWDRYTKQVNNAQMAVAKTTPNVAFVSSEGLTSRPDNIHFNAASQREFGRRYAAAYLGLSP